jgi:hypothetical protein
LRLVQPEADQEPLFLIGIEVGVEGAKGLNQQDLGLEPVGPGVVVVEVVQFNHFHRFDGQPA